MTNTESLNRLLTIWEGLAERERTLFLTYGARLWAGQKKYGPVQIGKKKWGYEAIEEALDASVYLTAMLADWGDEALAKVMQPGKVELPQEEWWLEMHGSVISPDGTTLVNQR